MSVVNDEEKDHFWMICGCSVDDVVGTAAGRSPSQYVHAHSSDRGRCPRCACRAAPDLRRGGDDTRRDGVMVVHFSPQAPENRVPFTVQQLGDTPQA